MKKLCRKGKVHPSPPPISDRLSLLPATILTLAAALSPEDKQVLAYLISCSAASTNRKPTPKTAAGDHRPVFNCDCFCCYMSFWVRWDSSPNRQLIHEIIDAYEDSLFQDKKKNKNKSGKAKRTAAAPASAAANKSKNRAAPELINDGGGGFGGEGESGESESVEASCSDVGAVAEAGDGGEVGGGGEGEKGSVRRLVSFIGERIFWGVWSK